MTFHLRVYDNFHYMEETEAYNTGSYATYEEALSAAKSIVEEFFVFNWKKGMTFEELRSLFMLYGDDPIIVPNEHGESIDYPNFSARDYAYSIVEDLFQKFENQ